MLTQRQASELAESHAPCVTCNYTAEPPGSRKVTVLKFLGHPQTSRLPSPGGLILA